jgi:hypothetical protein
MDSRRHATAREPQERLESGKHGGRPWRGRMLAAGIVVFFAAAAAALGQPGQSTGQEERDQPSQVQPEPPQPGPEQQFRERFEQQRRELIQRQEELGRMAQETEEQLRQSRRDRQEQSRQLEGQLDEIRGQMRQIDQELAELHRREVAERTRILVDQLRDHQEQAQRIERELRGLRQAGERQRRGPDENMRPAPGPRMREREERQEDLGRPPEGGANESPAPRPQGVARGPLQELRQGQDALQAEMQRLKQQVQGACAASEQQQAQDRADREERGELPRQMEMLRDRTNRLEGELNASNERNRVHAEGSNNAARDLRATIELMQQRMARLERERLERQEVCAAETKELCARVDKVQEELTQTHALLDSMISEANRSTVGSAGYAWGW